jgi:cytochrome P450
MTAYQRQDLPCTTPPDPAFREDPYPIQAPEFDLIEHFAGPLPVIVIAERLGVDARDREQFKQWKT